MEYLSSKHCPGTDVNLPSSLFIEMHRGGLAAGQLVGACSGEGLPDTLHGEDRADEAAEGGLGAFCFSAHAL